MQAALPILQLTSNETITKCPSHHPPKSVKSQAAVTLGRSDTQPAALRCERFEVQVHGALNGSVLTAAVVKKI